MRLWFLEDVFWGLKIRHGFEIYFWVDFGNDKSKGNNSVASRFGLRSGLRQSGGAPFGATLSWAEAPPLILKATARHKADSFWG